MDDESFLEAIEQQTLPEQLYIFEGLQRTLAMPLGTVSFPYPFYFHMLDGYRPEAVSLGHHPEVSKPEDAKKFEEQIQQAMVKCNGGNGDLIEILSYACQGVQGCEDLIRGAKAFVAFRGQPLSPTPSRLEQCLTIHSELGPDDPRVRDAILDLEAGVYKVEDYLGPSARLEEVYAKAFIHGGRKHANSSPRAIPTTATLPYLAAEHLLLAMYHKDASGRPDIRSLLRHKPGMAILPFTVLGQCRAAGVWFYRGAYNSEENFRLREHLKLIGAFANRWLSTTVSQMVVSSSNMMIFRALSSFQDSEHVRLASCRRVQRALSNLWFSRSLNVRRASQGEEIHVNPGAQFVTARGCRSLNIALEFAAEAEVIELLGFDTAEFQVPFYLHNQEPRLLETMLRNLNEVILSEHQRARKRAQANIQVKLNITAHDYANAINSLVIFADPMGDRGSGLSAELRLEVVRRVASHMRGHAWILREVSKADADPNLDRTSSQPALTDFGFSPEDPTPEDLQIWQNYLYWEALYTAYVARERYPARTGARESTFKLNYRFECPEALADGTAVPPRQRIVTVDAAALVEGMQGGQAKQRPHWPLKAAAGKGAKLDDLGRCSIMLWGALELLRNACEKTAALLSNGQAAELEVSVSLEILRVEGEWSIRIVIENPTERPPPELEKYLWYEPMRQLMSNVRFRNVSSPGRAAYEFQLEVG